MRSFSVRPARLILVHPLQSPLPFRLIPVSPSSHIPLYHSVSRHPRQPSSYTPFYLFISFNISFNISSHLCVFSPLVLDPWGKCRVFLRKWFTFPRGRQGYRLHRPLWQHSSFPPPGKVPGISAKTVHFPPWPAGALAPQTPLAALAVSPLGESAVNSRENGSLSPVA